MQLGGISLDFAGIAIRCDENFSPHEHMLLGQLTKLWIDFSLMSGIRSGITSKLDLKMATLSTTMTTIKKNNKT